MPRLAGKVAFITGAGNGIGRATAILFACQGAKVAIGEIDTQAGEETAHLAGNEAIAIRADVTDPDSLQAAIRATVEKFGRLDVLHTSGWARMSPTPRSCAAAITGAAGTPSRRASPWRPAPISRP